LIRATLLADGSSDRVLIPMLEWLITEMTTSSLTFEWADLGVVRRKPTKLVDRVAEALRLYPCDLLFVHRDAEAQPPEWRHREIAAAVPELQTRVAVVPVRMQEAWLLHDEAALRKAAGRPSGTEPLSLPALAKVEAVVDPKATLNTALLTAAALTGRRRQSFNAGIAAQRLAMLIEDWAPLRQLSAFRQLEDDTRDALVGMKVALR